MNCKQGDIAVIVRSNAGNEGRFVVCVRLASQRELDEEWFVDDQGPVWVIDRPLLSSLKTRMKLCRDSSLRPIRPGDISDEEVRDLYLPKSMEPA